MNFEEKKKRVDKAKAELDEYVQRVNRLLDDLFRVENDVNVKEWWMLKSGEAIQVAGSVAGVVTEICTVHLSVHDIEVIRIRFSNCVLRYEKRFFLSMFKKVDWDATPESIENKEQILKCNGWTTAQNDDGWYWCDPICKGIRYETITEAYKTHREYRLKGMYK